MSATKIVAGVVFVGIGAAISMFVGSAFVDKRRFLSKAVRAQGKVVDYRRKDFQVEDSVTTAWHPVLEFSDAQGVPRRTTARSPGEPERLPVGSSVTLLYDPAEPAQVEIYGFFSLWGGQLLAISCAAVALALGLGAVLG